MNLLNSTNNIGRLSNDGLGGTHYESQRLRQRRKAHAFCLSVRGFTRYAVRETLALDTLEGPCRTFPILDAKARAVIIAEVKFREIAVQMLFADMMIGSNHTALEN